ncbi:hypothetical protein SAMN05519103_09405 [Rhizobiales bacterium GAS113]|nr:hypothetical protein SAMN05519103_09405 [Rhizobiales bacterium GAS113]
MGNPYLVTLRLASVVCSKTKSELITAARELDGKGMKEELIDRFQDASRLFRSFADLVATAEIRQMVAIAAMAIEDDPKAATRRRSRPRPT